MTALSCMEFIHGNAAELNYQGAQNDQLQGTQIHLESVG